MPELSPLAASVRQHDPDRFLCALFAPPERRETLLLLYAFNHELARAREVTREPTLALIRLQWWREVVLGADRFHEVATPLAAALRDGRLEAGDLLAMIEGREPETEPEMPTLRAFEDYVEGSAGALAAAAGRVLGADGATRERLRALGAAYGVAGQIRSVAPLLGQRRCLLPADLLAGHGLTPDSLVSRPDDARLPGALRDLAAAGLRLWTRGRGRFARVAVAAALPGVLGGRDLQRAARSRPQPHPRRLGDRLAVLVAAARGRV